MDKTTNKKHVFVVCFWKGFFSANAPLEWVWIDCVTNSKTLTPEKKLVNYKRLCNFLADDFAKTSKSPIFIISKIFRAFVALLFCYVVDNTNSNEHIKYYTFNEG